MKKKIATAVFFFSSLVHAEQSYSEKLREQIKKSDEEKAEKTASKDKSPDANQGSYTEQLKKKLKEEDSKKATEKSDGKSYIEELQEKNPDLRPKSESENYSAEKKDKVAPERASSIDAIKAGKPDELVLKRPGTPRFMIELKMEVVGTRDFTADDDSEGAEFDNVYPGKWRPDFHVKVEYEFLRRESVGSMGIFAETGVASFVGKGQFPFAKGTFGTNAQTEFRLYTIPAFVGLSFRWNTLKYLRPYVSVGGGAMFFWETRDDDKDAVRAYSMGAVGSGGVNILLDGISDRAAWALYDTLGFKHYFLNLDFTYMNVTKGPIQHKSSLFFVGIAFEI